MYQPRPSATPLFIQPGMVLDDGTNVRLSVQIVHQGGLGVVAMGPDARHNNEWYALKTFNPYNLHAGNTLRSLAERESYHRTFTRRKPTSGVVYGPILTSYVR